MNQFSQPTCGAPASQASHAAAPRDATLTTLLASMKRRLALGGAALLCALAVGAPAHAVVIDFEGYSGLAGHSDFIDSGGFSIGFFANLAQAQSGDMVGAFLDGTDPTSCIGGACPVNNGGTYYGAVNDSYLDIISNDGTPFHFGGFDASFIGASNDLLSYPGIAGLVRVQGFFSDGSSAYETYLLDGPGPGGFNFAHFVPSAAFGQLAFNEVAIFGFSCNGAGNCSAFSTDQGQFGIDNLAVSAVPEPASALMLGIGLIGMLAVTRRRRA